MVATGGDGPAGAARRAASAPLVLALLLIGACDRSAPDGATQAAVMAAVKVDGRAGTLAGISARGRLDVPRYRPRQFGADTASGGFREFRRRCATCHNAPRPDLHTAAEWDAVVARMDAAMAAAGVLGLSPQERGAILELLRRHAKR
ncbi:MAG TPA: hypothetical protein VK939_06970 [Longimicrobiales bacterium]|nr:hypothetical protein [Longimicrobiales bacterium]